MTEVNVEWKGGMEFDCQGEENGAEITIGKGELAATESFLMGLATCSTVNILMILEKKRFDLEDLKINVTGDIPDEKPRFYQTIHMDFQLKGDILEEELDRIFELAEKNCPLWQTIRPETEVTYDYELN
ncbi:MAG: OsmC family protein [Bacillota bacterium]